ncbi:MAG: hypothetical protein V1778_01275 [bacterium]
MIEFEDGISVATDGGMPVATESAQVSVSFGGVVVSDQALEQALEIARALRRFTTLPCRGRATIIVRPGGVESQGQIELPMADARVRDAASAIVQDVMGGAEQMQARGVAHPVSINLTRDFIVRVPNPR